MTQNQTAPARSQVGALRQFHRPHRPGSPSLVVLPHAGGGASAYRGLSERFSQAFTVLVMQYPGRQDRLREPPATSLMQLAAAALADYRARPDTAQEPVTVFGHSMGAIVGFEFVRMAEQHGVPVAALVASSAAAPSRVADLPRHPTDDAGLMAHLSALAGTGDPVLGNDAVMRMALPALRADYQAFDAYSCRADATVAAPIAAIGGAEDPVIAPRELHGWSQHADSVSVSVVDGGHFYLYDAGEDLLEVLTETATSVSR